MSVPSKADILVIGGGPAGSYAASCLAREGLDVVLLEADKFPRYHIGESTLPSMHPFLRFIDFEDEFANYGFYKKVGAAFKLSKEKPEAYTDFLTGGKDNNAWNVIRSQSDHMLLLQAGKNGAKVFQETSVVDIQFAPNTTRPVSASWKNNKGETGSINYTYLVDASGRRGLMSTKYLNNRVFTQSLKNLAIWSYWTGAGSYAPGTPRACSPFFEALLDESGWAWFIPLHDGTTSVGIVINQDIYKRKKSESNLSTTELYVEQLKLTPNITRLIGTGALVETPEGPKVKSASDYSYSAAAYAGDHFRIIGDAGAFIDPLFSSGIHLALGGGLSAATTICASLRGDCPEEEAARWHTARVGTSYTVFLVVVLSAYQQMRAQEMPILTDVNSENFDKAFEQFRPIIQGTLDSVSPSNYKGEVVNEDELQKTMDFCSQVYMQRDEDVRLTGILDVAESVESIASSPFYGLSPRFERGKLGLKKAVA